MKKKIAIIAGRGALPQIVAKSASSRGIEVVTISFLMEVFNAMEPYSDNIYRLKIGCVGRVIRTLKDECIRELILVGKFEKRMLFENLAFDLKAIGMLRKMFNKNDDTLMLTIVEELKKNGITVLPQVEFLSDLICHKGIITKKEPSKSEYKDIEYGFSMAKSISGIDIGQTVVVKDQAVLAVEAIEGTDEAIKRGCCLGGQGAVVVKVSKPNQDLRFDIPTVGLNTLHVMKEGGASVLAIEADKTIMVDRENFLSFADSSKISVIAV